VLFLRREKVRVSETYVISGFRREVAKNCALLGYNTASSGNFFGKLPLLAA
jgi:hypothetical protein